MPKYFLRWVAQSRPTVINSETPLISPATMERDLMAKPKMTAEEKAEDEAYDRLEKARGHFAKAVIAADVETEMGLHTCGTAGLLDVMFDAEHEFLDAYFAHIDAMEAAEAKPGKSATPKSDAVAAATA